MAPLLAIRGLKTHFATDDGILQAVDGVDITIEKGETLGVVGESGCGKTVTAMSILKLIAMPPGRIVEGEIMFEGRDLVPLTSHQLDEVRAKEIGFIFQEPMTSLNPVLTVGEQIAESLRVHEGLSNKHALARTVEMLKLVQIPNAEARVHDYPHQFSGGMRQRVMIAMALACKPKLVIADEPTTALDVTIQAQILDLLQDMKERFGMAVMLITHAMGVVAETAQRVVVMYAGKIVEEAGVDSLFEDPRHPYTQGLIRSIPRIDLDSEHKIRLEAIGGTVPILINPAPGCRFAPRCRHVMSHLHRKGAGVARDRARPSHGLPSRSDAMSDPSMANPCCRSPISRKHFPVLGGLLSREVGSVHAVDGVSFTVNRGETLGVVGESGCGKSTTCRCVLRLIEPTSGEIVFDGQDVLGLGGNDLRALRRKMQIVFQDPFASLNPRMTVGAILGEALIIHKLGAIGGRAGGSGGKPARQGRAEGRAYAPLPARIFRRPAPAHRDRARARGGARAHRLRRAGFGARRLNSGAGDQSAGRPAERAQPHLSVRGSRSLRGGAHLRPRRGHVSRPYRRTGQGQRSLPQSPASLYAGAAFGRAGAGPESEAQAGSACKAMCRAR